MKAISIGREASIMFTHETDLRKKAFDELFIPQVDTVVENNRVHNYTLALLGILTIVLSKLF
jgi:predicted nucleotide-binding protein (sugar kinase/HSP70/actin superfamily)